MRHSCRIFLRVYAGSNQGLPEPPAHSMISSNLILLGTTDREAWKTCYSQSRDNSRGTNLLVHSLQIRFDRTLDSPDTCLTCLTNNRPETILSFYLHLDWDKNIRMFFSIESFLFFFFFYNINKILQITITKRKKNE